MKKKQIIGVMAIAMLLVGALIAPASADDQTCKDLDGFTDNLSEDSSGDWGSVDWLGTPNSDAHIELTVSPNYQVELCLKKGNDGPVVTGWLGEGVHDLKSQDYYPGLGDDGFSHYAVRYREVFDVSYTKQWTGDIDDDDLVGVSVTFDVSIDGDDPIELADGETLTLEGVPADYDIELVGENVSGLDLPEECGYAPSESIVDPDNHNITVTNTVTCEEPETQTISFTKVWEGDEFEGSEDVEVTFDVLIDGEGVTLADGEESEEFPADAEWSFVGENVTGFPDDTCEYTADVSTEDGTVTNTVVCAEVQPVVVVEPEPEPETVTVEVLGESIEATSAERLPETGASTLLLALLGLTAMGSGGAILRRR